MTRNICIVAAMVMLLGACVWTYYATAPVQSLEVLSFRVTVNGPSGPPGMGLVRNAVGFASMFAFGIVAFCLASTLRSKQSTEQLSRAGSSLVCLAGVNTIVAGGISFFSMSAVLRAFLEFASSPIAPKESDVRAIIDFHSQVLLYGAVGCVVAAVVVLLAIFAGSRGSSVELDQKSKESKSQHGLVGKFIAAAAVMLGLVVVIAVYRAASGSSGLIDTMGSGTPKPSDLGSCLVAIIGGSRHLFFAIVCLGTLLVGVGIIGRQRAASNR